MDRCYFCHKLLSASRKRRLEALDIGKVIICKECIALKKHLDKVIDSKLFNRLINEDVPER